jgi:hypothetical protein
MEDQQPDIPNITQEKPCRHEYIKLFQRRLKGLDRRMMSTRGYLPVGFKQADFGHLGEGSYCFCAKCRTRLYPRRTQADKAAARLALAQNKANDALLAEELSELALDLSETSEADVVELVAEKLKETSTSEVSVDELDYESTEMEEIQKDGVKLTKEDDDEEDLAQTDEGI